MNSPQNSFLQKNIQIFLVFTLLYCCPIAKAQNSYYGSYGEFVSIIAETVPLFDKGFLHYSIDVSSKESTTLQIDFFDINGESSYSHKINLPKLIYLGNAHDNENSVFLFQDLNIGVLYYVSFSENGKRVSYNKKSYESGLFKSMVIYYDNEGFYTNRKVGNSNTITKISYKTDTLWSEKLIDKGNDFVLHKTAKSYGRLYLNFMGKLFCLDDKNGNVIYQTHFTNEFKIRQFYSFLVGANTVTIVGEEMERKKRKPENDLLFTIELDSNGQVLSEKEFPLPSNSIAEAETAITFVKDIVAVEDGYKIIGETISKTKHTSALIGHVIAGAMAAATGVGGVGPNTRSAFITSHNMLILTPDGNNLSNTQLPKSPVKKLYGQDLGHAGHEMHTFFNYLRVFDYLFSFKHADKSVSLFYVSQLTQSNIKITRTTIVNKDIQDKCYTFDAKDISSVRMYMISENKALVTLGGNKGVSFNVIDL